MKVAIVGLGYVGLPLAMQFASTKATVVGLNIDEAKVALKNRGQSYIKHIEPEAIQTALKDERFCASTDFSRIKNVEAVIICVPTPLTKNREPDISFVLETGRAIAPYLSKGALVVLESTTYPERPRTSSVLLEQVSGMKTGVDFHLAFSPEREDPGNSQSKVKRIPKVIGGYTPACRDKAITLYSRAINTLVPVVMSSSRGHQAAGKYFPERQHRAGERAKARVCRNGH